MVLHNSIGIIAGSYEQYDQWRRRGLDWGQDTFYVVDEFSLRGRHSGIVLVIGTGYQKVDLILTAKDLGFEVR